MFNKLKKLIFKVINFWQKHTPVKKNLVLLESVGDMSDNAYPIFEYLLNNTYKYKFIWVVKDPKKYKNTNKVKYIPYTMKNIYSIYYFAKSKYCFYTHERCGIQNKKSQLRIYLTHGFSYKNTKNQFWDVNFNSVVIRMSEYHRELGNLCNPGEIRLSIPLGYPRDDVLVKGPSQNVTIGNGYNKLFVWLPTFRTHKNNFTAYKNDKINEFNLITSDNLKIINETLKADDSLLIIKYHPAQELDKADFEELSNIKTMSNDDLLNEGIKLYDLLSVSDALITDFSSVFADYLLTDKPIAFELSDYQNYASGKGFIIDNPLEKMPGKFIYNISDFADFINDVIIGKDCYKAERKKQRDIIHKYQDGNSTQRILSYFNLI